MMLIYNPYFWTTCAIRGRNVFTNLNPSSGGSGIILNTANAMLINENVIQNCITIFGVYRRISVCLSHANVAYINIIIIPMIARMMFVAGHANATRSSPSMGFL